MYPQNQNGMRPLGRVRTGSGARGGSLAHSLVGIHLDQVFMSLSTRPVSGWKLAHPAGARTVRCPSSRASLPRVKRRYIAASVPNRSGPNARLPTEAREPQFCGLPPFEAEVIAQRGAYKFFSAVFWEDLIHDFSE